MGNISIFIFLRKRIFSPVGGTRLGFVCVAFVLMLLPVGELPVLVDFGCSCVASSVFVVVVARHWELLIVMPLQRNCISYLS